MTGFPPRRPIVIVDSAEETLTVATRVMRRVERERAIVPLSAPALVRTYLRDATNAGRTPALVILRMRREDRDANDLFNWIRVQDGPVGRLPILLLTDRIVSETDGLPEAFIERAIRAIPAEER